jgi:hypothetical protein
MRAMEKFLPGSAPRESLAYFNYNISIFLPFHIAQKYLFVLSFTLTYPPFCSTTKFINRKGPGSKSLKRCACIMRSTLGEWTEDIFKAFARSEPPKWTKSPNLKGSIPSGWISA